jgi:uncharacterized membrane protein YfcA
LLYGIDIKVVGSLSLAIPLPTMVLAFARYSRHHAFSILRPSVWFIVGMTAGSVAGAVAGALLLSVVPVLVLIPALALLLTVSAIKVWRH